MKSNIFQLKDGGHCYLRAEREGSHIVISRLPNRVRPEDLLSLATWANGDKNGLDKALLNYFYILYRSKSAPEDWSFAQQDAVLDILKTLDPDIDRQ